VLSNIVEATDTNYALGGAVCLTYVGETTIQNNLFAGNRASGPLGGHGGGIQVGYTPARIQNNIFVNNVADRGAGISIANTTGSPPTPIINNTIAGNTSWLAGGGLRLLNADAVVLNTIMYGDTCNQEIYVSGSSIVRVLYSDIQGGWPSDSGNIGEDPQFTDNTYRLANTSGCREKGVDSIQLNGAWYHAPPFCIYGMARPTPSGTRPDIGACENPVPVVSVEESQSGVPTSSALSQNYPNPFNPSTTINYQLPTVNHVTLKVYDVLGREVATLVDEVKQPGTYSVQWDASEVASGVYYYRLTSGEFTQTKKLILLR
jgi:hypothetical protein